MTEYVPKVLFGENKLLVRTQPLPLEGRSAMRSNLTTGWGAPCAGSHESKRVRCELIEFRNLMH